MTQQLVCGEDPEPSERGPAGPLFVPVRPGPAGCVARLFRTPVGGRTAVAFTTPQRLTDELGARQPWIRLSEPALRALTEPLGVPRVTVDPRLTPGSAPRGRTSTTDHTPGSPAPPSPARPVRPVRLIRLVRATAHARRALARRRLRGHRRACLPLAGPGPPGRRSAARHRNGGARGRADGLERLNERCGVPCAGGAGTGCPRAGHPRAGHPRAGHRDLVARAGNQGPRRAAHRRRRIRPRRRAALRGATREFRRVRLEALAWRDRRLPPGVTGQSRRA
ncbi:SAV_915 family protein [Streptomyces alboflavus]|uniref:SAV_915 family protein n=1 Tax=Streptomyces alboflavus TaxID=67267 RepID=UPI0031F8D249